MKILVVCQYFWPERFRVNDVAIALKERGHEVTVITGIPNYPSGEFFSGYGFFGKYRESYHGATVLRAPIIPRGRDKPLQLALNYLSFAIFGSLLVPFLASEQYDIILVYALSPIIQAIPAFILKMIDGTPVQIWLQDLWPESLSATGAVRSKWVMRVAGVITGWIHRYADLNLVSCDAFSGNLKAMDVDQGRIRYLPNYAEDLYSQEANPAVVAECDASLPKGFRVMFAGNIGEAQDFPTILDAAVMLRGHKEVQWIILGDGRKFTWLKEEVERRGLQDVFHLIGTFPVEQMPQWFSCADVMLVSLRNDPIFAITLPTKVHSYMAASKPIVAALEGEAARVIKEAQCGPCVHSGDAAELAGAILETLRMDSQNLRRLGENGKKYFDVHFEKQQVISQLEDLMQATCNGEFQHNNS